MKQYIELIDHVLLHGLEKTDRTNTGTISTFGYQNRYRLIDGFPAVTTKKLAWKSVVSELLWFIEGSGDERRLCELLHGVRDADKRTIWTDNATAPYWAPKARFSGDLGAIYGVQWRSWGANTSNTPVDQLANLIRGLKADPAGRRHIISAWNPSDLDNAALPPCHCLAQFNVADGKLDCQMYQRSADAFLGVPFNIASYSLLTHMVAQVCNLEVGDFIHTFGDLHIYKNHLDAVEEQKQRPLLPLPKLWLNPEIKDITKFTMDDIKLVDYVSGPAISASMAV